MRATFRITVRIEKTNGVRESPSPPLRHHQQVQQHQERQGGEHQPQVGGGLRAGVERRAHGLEDARREPGAEQPHAGPSHQEEACGHAHHPARLALIASPHGLADQDVGRHGQAEGRPDHQEEDLIGVGDRRQRGLAQRVADPDGVGRAVDRLQQVGAQHRQGEQDQRLADRPRRQIDPGAARCPRPLQGAFPEIPRPWLKPRQSRDPYRYCGK
ncbi:hypothetical protein LRS10_08260 [Phenylobacterium sp. J426]|nr:hypothetical protein [Phenylobacterium sp. J426]MCR5874155.1 hypothetical protein [Phenylobacterium sp. J426]